MSDFDNFQHRFAQMLADPTLDAAYAWHAEITDHPLDWAATREELRGRLATGEYAFAPLHRVHTGDGFVDQWEEVDQIVLKALTLVLHAALGEDIPPHVYDLRGGAGAAVTHMHKHIADNPNTWVMTADLSGYGEQIDHAVLYRRVAERLPGEPYLLRLVWQYLRHSVEDGGEYQDIEQGLARGCPLSALLGALYLKPLDDLLEQESAVCARCMGEWVALFPTRWALRSAEARINSILDGLKLTRHSEETFIGRAERGFELLGYHLAPAVSEAVAPVLKGHRKGETGRLYEQGADNTRIERYLSGWQEWAQEDTHETVVVAPPAPQPAAAIKRLTLLAAGVTGAAAGLISMPAMATLIPFSVSATAPKLQADVNLTYSFKSVSVSGAGLYAAAFGGVLGSTSYAVGILGGYLSGTGWQFASGNAGGGPVGVNAVVAGNSFASSYSYGYGASTQAALDAIGAWSQNFYFSNGAGAGWATISYDGPNRSASVVGAVNTSGGIVFGTDRAPTTVPEPAPLALLAAGAVAGLPFARRRRRARRSADSTTGA